MLGLLNRRTRTMTNDLLPTAGRQSATAFVAAPVGRRLVAAFIDCWVIIGYALFVFLSVSLVPQIKGWLSGWLSRPATAHVTGFLLVTFPAAAYLVAADASSSGATFGKRLMGIRVISTAGGHLSIFRSVLRTGIRFIPWELAHSAVWRIHLGAEFSPHSIPFLLLIACYALVLANVSSQFFDHRHRAIYDFIARSQVNWISAKPRISTPIADR